MDSPPFKEKEKETVGPPNTICCMKHTYRITCCDILLLCLFSYCHYRTCSFHSELVVVITSRYLGVDIKHEMQWGWLKWLVIGILPIGLGYYRHRTS